MSHEVDSIDRQWMQFERQFPTEEDCVELLYSIFYAKRSWICRYCGTNKFKRIYGERILKCVVCRKQVSFTSGTLFERARRTRPWLGAIWLMDHGLLVSSSRFHRLVGIAQSSAQTIFRKVATVIHSHMCVDESIPSGLFSKLFSKRSRQTPANEHPRAEQYAIEQEYTESSSSVAGVAVNPDSDPSDKEGAQEWCKVAVNASLMELGIVSSEVDGQSKELLVLSQLSQSPMHVDKLVANCRMPVGEVSAVLTMLELAGSAMRLTGDWYMLPPVVDSDLKTSSTASMLNLSMEMSRTIAVCIESIRGAFHGISRKYLQSYLAIHWCYVDRARWSGGRLLDACWRALPVSSVQILNYVTPLLVKVVAFG